MAILNAQYRTGRLEWHNGIVSPLSKIGTNVLVAIVSVVEFGVMSTSLLGAGPSWQSTTLMLN